MRLLALVSLGFLLAGCQTPTWYAATPSGTTAKLRVVASAPGNTYIVSATGLKCPASAYSNIVGDSDRLLGWFHPSGGQSFQADRRGFNRRVSMPGGSAFPEHMYAEHIVDAGAPIDIRVTNVFSQGSPYDIGFCHTVGRVTLTAGKNYELFFRGNGPQCDMRLAEVLQESSERVERVNREFVEGPRNCRFGG
jgi:hypothetical protein